MVGGEFLHDTMKELSSMTKKAKVSKQGYPYMYEMYNINGYFTGMGTTGPLKIVNTLIDALNDEDHLAKYVLFIPDKDLLVGSKNSAFMMGATMHYIVKQVDLFLERQHQDLLHKRLGALQPEFPKSIWICMLKHPVDKINENLKIFNL